MENINNIDGDKNMTVGTLRQEISSGLSSCVDTGEARAIRDEIVRYLLGLEPVAAVLAANREVESETVLGARKIVARVCAGEPLQYILGRAWFMGMYFKVTPAVLIPRPETAQMVDIITDAMGKHVDLNVLDVGTGSGCIAIALSRALTFAKVTGMDISADALEIARENGKMLKTNVKFVKGDALQLDKIFPDAKWDVIVSNPPYITRSEQSNMDARVYEQEPAGALFVPEDNPLVFHRAIGEYAIFHLTKSGLLVMEINPLLASPLKTLLLKEGFGSVDIVRDYKGNLRFVVCRL